MVMWAMVIMCENKNVYSNRRGAESAKDGNSLCVLCASAVKHYFSSRQAFGNGVEVSVWLASSTFSGKRIVLESLFNFSLILIELKSTSEVSFDFMALQKYVFSLPEMLYVLCNVTAQSCFLPQRHRENQIHNRKHEEVWLGFLRVFVSLW